jgi:hypothetical protein
MINSLDIAQIFTGDNWKLELFNFTSSFSHFSMSFIILQLPKNNDCWTFIIITAFLVEDRMVNPFLLYIVEICYSLFIAWVNGRNSLFTFKYLIRTL